VTALSAMLVDGPGSDFEEGLGVILTEPYTIHHVRAYGGSPRDRCSDCTYQESKYCSTASVDQMERSSRMLTRFGLPIPPCLKDFE